jgi:choline-sulfatase
MRRLVQWCSSAVLALVLAGCGGHESSAPISGHFRGAPVIVISIDTLRADHLPAYGYSGVATPNIDALRADSTLFTNAWSHCPLTLPSHTSLLTGELPFENGVRDNIGYRLASHGQALPQLFKSSGYETAAAVSAYVLRGETGLGRLFDSYDDQISFQPGVAAGSIQRPGAKTIDAAVKWLRPRRSRPFFYLLHLFEPHTPYDAPEPFRSSTSSPYDAEIAYADALLGQFVAQLKRDGIYDHAIVVLLSDHGEGLGDHGEGEHGIFLYRETLHVPLMIKLPGGAGAGRSDSRTAGLTDLAPTLAALTQLHAPANWHGRSLFDPVAVSDAREIYGESLYGHVHLGWAELRSLVAGQHQFIEAPRPELYDLSRDPAEKTNIAAEDRRAFSRMRDALAKYPRELQAPSPASDEEMKKLAALGYLTGAASASGPAIDPKDGIADLSLYTRASALAHAGDYPAAITAYRELVARNPRFSDARTQLAAAYEATGQFASAEAEYREVLRQSPSAVEQVGVALGAVYLNLGQYDQAEAHARLGLEKNRGGAEMLLGRVAMARRDYAAAEQHAASAMSDAHFHTAAVLLKADALVARQQPARALELLDQEKKTLSADDQPLPGLLESARGDALMRLHRPTEAESAFRDEIRTYPDDRDAYTSLAAVFAVSGRPGEIEPLLRTMVTANPDPQSYALAVRTLNVFGLKAQAAEWMRRGEGAIR